MRESNQTCLSCGALVPAPILSPGAVLNLIPPRYCSACGAQFPSGSLPDSPELPEAECMAAGSAQLACVTAPVELAKPTYIDRQLLPGERVCYRTRQHPARLARAVLLGLLTVVAFAFIALAAPVDALLDIWVGPSQAALAWGIILVGVCGLVLLGVISSLLGLSASELAVTDRRILGRVGGLVQRRVDIPLKDIASLSASGKTLSLLGHGSVAVSTPGRGARQFNFIPDPFTFCQALLVHFPGESERR